MRGEGLVLLVLSPGRMGQQNKSVASAFTWFLNHSIAGVCYFLSFGLIWVLVVVEVAINSTQVAAQCQQFCDAAPILRLICLNPCGNKGRYETGSSSLSAYLSITAKHSFLQVKRLPRRSRKVPGVVVMGGGVCLHSISSIGNGAGRIFRVAPCVRTGLCLVQMDGSGWPCQTPHQTGMKYRGCRRTRPERRLATLLLTRWDGCEAMEAELS